MALGSLPAAGVDAGASLIKLAIRDSRGELTLASLSASAAKEVLGRVRDCPVGRVALTGCGAAELAQQIEGARRIEEFNAWANGARARVDPEGAGGPFLLISMGTGTSALRVSPGAAERVGGTALGGGTLLGLSAALVGTRDFDQIAALAARGDRSQVDLTIGDLYGDDFEIPALFTAASFGKLMPNVQADPSDLAQGIMGLIGENVGKICASLARENNTQRVIFAGGCLRGNDYLANLLRGMCLVVGLDAEVLENGEYTGALGALQLVESG